MKSPPRRGVWGYPPPENFEILSPRKCDFPDCEAQPGYEFIAFKIGCIYFIFLQVIYLSCFNLGGSIDPPELPLDPPQKRPTLTRNSDWLTFLTFSLKNIKLTSAVSTEYGFCGRDILIKSVPQPPALCSKKLKR